MLENPSVIIALIGFVQALMLGVLGKIGIDSSQARKDSEITRKEVKNSHSTNLREDLDKQHEQVMTEIRGVRSDVKILNQRDLARGEELQDVREDIRSVEKKISCLDRKISSAV